MRRVSLLVTASLLAAPARAGAPAEPCGSRRIAELQRVTPSAAAAARRVEAARIQITRAGRGMSPAHDQERGRQQLRAPV